MERTNALFDGGGQKTGGWGMGGAEMHLINKKDAEKSKYWGEKERKALSRSIE